MERKLRALFDYQKFAPDASLSALIDSVHARHPSRELNMEELEQAKKAVRGEEKERPTPQKAFKVI